MIRIIPKLDIKGPNLIKGVHLEGLRVIGDPNERAREYYDAGIDEIVYMDIVASLYNRNSLAGIVEQTEKQGGGLRTLLHELVRSQLFQTR